MNRPKLSQIATFIHEEFWLFLLGSIAMAFVFPEFGRNVLKPLALPSILAQMYVVMLNIEPHRLVAALKAWRPLARSLALLFVLTPLLAMLGHLFYPPAVLLGLAVVCSMPSGMSSPFFALQFGGDAALAVVTTTVSHLIVPLIAPLLVKLIAGGVLQVEPEVIFLRLLQLVVLPFVLALITRRLLGGPRTTLLYSKVGWTSGMFIIVVTWGIVADVTVASIPLLPLALGVTALNGIMFLAGFLFGGVEKRTLSMTSGYRNVTLGMVLSISVWGDPLVALPSAVFTLTQNAFAVLMLFVHRRKAKR
jgi:BASS family bile acid:Na+ symporter